MAQSAWKDSAQGFFRSVKVAVIFDQLESAGGGYRQSLTAARIFSKVPAHLAVPVFLTTHQSNIEVLARHGIKANYLEITRLGVLSMRLRYLVGLTSIHRLLKKLQPLNGLERQLAVHDVDLVYFLSPTNLSLYLERLNFISTVWDVSHRDELEFPEVRKDLQFEAREFLYRKSLPKATAVLVDSELGRRRMLHRYGLDEERVHVMPFSIPAGAATVADAGAEDLAERFNLDKPYIFYPAQFWAHKNHVYLLHGLKILESTFGRQVCAVFSGSNRGNMAHVRAQAESLGLAERVKFAGFVSDEEMFSLYKQAVALVMPTYFGPTNLPPLEAFSLGVPVLYPDRPGLRDQVGEAALLMDLSDPATMAAQLDRLMGSAELRQTLIAAGRKLVAGDSDETRVAIMNAILQEFRARRAAWGSDFE